MNQYRHLSFKDSDIICSETAVDANDWRLLGRLNLPDRFNNPQDGAVRRAVVVDVETTGLSTEKDEVIQLAILPFDYEVESGRILTVHKMDAFEGLRQPNIPITEEAGLITGITDAMVAGQLIDGDAVAATVAEADLVVAHNAAFDRVMVEKYWPCFVDKPWACTLDKASIFLP